MKSSKIATLVAASLLLCIASPSFAAEKSVSTAKTSSSSSSDEGGLGRVVDGSLMVTRVGGVGAGLLFGVPVAAVRQSYKWYTTWTPEMADHVGGKDFGPSCALVSLATAPAALVWGGVTGLYHGGKNGLQKGFGEPFNPSSFSMTKEYED